MLAAEVTPPTQATKGVGFGIEVLDYLKYGTLGLAGIILLFAFFLYRQANSLPAPQMVTAQAGVGAYMSVAKWLLIPCMILQILGFVLPYVFPPGPPPNPTKGVEAWIRLPPLQKGDDVRYGEVELKVVHPGVEPKSEQLIDEEKSLTIEENDIIVVNIKDVVDHVDKLSKAEKPPSSVLEPTKPHQ